jgi:rare lipoprotein A
MQNDIQKMSRAKCVATIALAWGLGAGISMVSMLASAAPSDTAPAPSDTAPAPSDTAPAAPTSAEVRHHPKRHLDRSGAERFGKASFYASRYGGKTMADGTPMQLNGDNAASITLPLGTTAKVTNLETGRSAVVTIRDRGPYVKGRIVDLSPSTARQIGIDRKKGLARVVVAPISIPSG